MSTGEPIAAMGPGRLAVTVAMLAAMLTACGQSVPDGSSLERSVAIDLVAEFPYTETAPHTREILLGDAASHDHLLRGWSSPTRLDDGRSGVRAVGRLSTVLFHAGRAPQPLTIAVERIRLGDGNGARRLLVFRDPIVADVNGRPLGAAPRGGDGDV